MRLSGLFALCAAILAAPIPAAQRPVTIADVVNPASSGLPPGSGRSIPLTTWSPDGRRFIVSEHGTLSLYDVESGRTREILPLSKLEAAAVKAAPLPASVPDPEVWTNRNVSEKTIQWFPDHRRILVSAAGDLFIVDTEKHSFEPLTQTAAVERDPKLSPDGHAVSFRIEHDLSVLDIASKHIIALTTNGAATLLNGQPDWVYPEELSLSTAHWWSPDSQSIAYLQFDTGREPIYPQVSLLAARGIAEPERYPKAGDPNAEVRLGIVSAAGGPTRWMDLGEPRNNLLARVVWSPDSREILAERLNRTQNKLDILLAATATGASRVILHEEDSKWINIKDAPVFLAPDRLLLLSERSGFFHLYVHGTDGKQQKQLTSGNWEVDSISAVDTKNARIFFTSKEVSPIERHLYSISFDGTGKRQLTSGEGTHLASLSPTCDSFLEDYGGVKAPPRSTLRRANGSELRLFRGGSPNAPAGELDLLPVQILTLKTADGAELYARLILPAHFQQGTKYPAVVVVYGGPGSQQIVNSWPGATWEQVLAQKGFVVWQLDNRGSTGRGHQFESPIYHSLGKQELADQREGIDFLLSKGYVDKNRIGMYGWSYGGFMTLYTATNAPGLLKAAVAGAPVTNWRNYDSIYTERYMGLPEDDPEAYRVTSPQIKAGEMKGTKLLMIHNIEDDNVHFQNSIQMANAFELAGTPFTMLVYSGKSHGVVGAPRRHLLEQMTQFFEDNLK